MAIHSRARLISAGTGWLVLAALNAKRNSARRKTPGAGALWRGVARATVIVVSASAVEWRDLAARVFCAPRLANAYP